jgi:phenylacetate-coenzyme A ligase PaaK-like adenylate-forming protein
MPATLISPASAAVRACAAAVDRALEIADTFFIVGGEPYTPEKAAVIEQAGARAASYYAMAEAGMIGIPCLDSVALDDVHLVTDKVATIQRSRPVGSRKSSVAALVHTTLLPASPKLMLNVESGDYGSLAERHCGCGVLPQGFRSHLHTIRSYEKLTSEGMSFLGGDLLSLLEDVLPRRFGGRPTDYQLLERERHGLPKVSLVVDRGVGPLDEGLVASTALEFLSRRDAANGMMAGLWAASGTLEVVRGDPHVTPGGKILPLQLLSA